MMTKSMPSVLNLHHEPSICRITTCRLEQAKELGVTPGPVFGQLQRGQAITTADGRTVQPAEVMMATYLSNPFEGKTSS